MDKRAGSLLAGFVVILLLVVILLPAVIQLLQGDANQSVNQRKSTIAFQLAEAAVAKGVSKLTETRKNWTDAVSGVAIPRFRGLDNEAFTDIAGGTYKVQFSTGSVPGTVRITGKGRDSSSKEVRVIEAEYSGLDPDTPAIIYNNGQWTASNSIYAHWGSVKSFNNVAVMPEVGFPRVFSAGSISNRDNNAAPPNTDGKHYWAFKSDMGSPPEPDLVYYKNKAINSVISLSSPNGSIRRQDGAPPNQAYPNSGLFQAGLNWGQRLYIDKLAALPEGPGNQYELRSPNSVLYFELNPNIAGFLDIYRAYIDVEALISLNCCLVISGSAIDFNVVAATIPFTAPYEYQGTWTLGAWPTGQQTWTSTFAGTYSNPNHCCYNISNLQIRGYVYVSGSSMATGVAKVQGVYQTTHGASYSGMTVYYDPDIAKNIVYTKTPRGSPGNPGYC
jgi:hypothetical protein